MRFEVGDLVVVKPWDKIVEEFGADLGSRIVNTKHGFSYLDYLATNKKPFVVKDVMAGDYVVGNLPIFSLVEMDVLELCIDNQHKMKETKDISSFFDGLSVR